MFVGGHRAEYCPGCRAERKKLQSREAQRRKRSGAADKRPTRNLKVCVVCGCRFESPPSDKVTTCSSACRSERARRSLNNRRKADPFGKLRMSPELNAKLLHNPEYRKALAANALKASEAAALIPAGQRGPQNRTAKHWELLDPDGNLIRVTNLKDWAREYYDFFEPDAEDIEAAATRIASGFRAIACSIRGTRSPKGRSVSTYKGWSLHALPKEKKKED